MQGQYNHPGHGRHFQELCYKARTSPRPSCLCAFSGRQKCQRLKKNFHFYCLRGLSHHRAGRRIIPTQHVSGTKRSLLLHQDAFGIASGPEEYQRRRHEFLDGLQGVINIADDICVFGCANSKEEADLDHDKNLTSLLEKCSKQDLRLSAKKVQFKSPSVTFMGHKLTDKGVEPDPAKVDAVTNMLTPTDKSGVQRFLGMCQYLSKFCHNLSETVLPLRDLTKEILHSCGQTTMKTSYAAVDPLVRFMYFLQHLFP